MCLKTNGQGWGGTSDRRIIGKCMNQLVLSGIQFGPMLTDYVAVPLKPRLTLFGLADVDLALEVGELDFGAAAVDGAVDGFVDLDAVLAALAAAVFDDGRGGRGAELDVEIAEDVAAVGTNADVGFEVGGEGNVDIAVEGAEGHGLLRIDAEEGGVDVAIEGGGDGTAGNVVGGAA